MRGKPQYSPDGVMPQGTPESVLKVLSSFSPNVQAETIDLAKTYTTEFVIKANATHRTARRHRSMDLLIRRFQDFLDFVICICPDAKFDATRSFAVFRSVRVFS